MIIVAGYLTVRPSDREQYLASCIGTTSEARRAMGCLEFHLSPDPLEPGRINVFERWDSVEDVERFRGSGPSDDQQEMILGADVAQYEIANSTSLT